MIHLLQQVFKSLQLDINKIFLEKRLYQVAPELRPVPNPLGREYLLLVQQHARIAFVQSVGALTPVSGIRWWSKVARYVSAYLVLKSTTAIVDSLLLEHRITQTSS